ncbi:hypothetical protein V2J09_001167 [Rumex salicifolius]
MNILLWNCSKAGKASFVKNINYTIHSRNVSMLGLFETQVSGEHADAICKRIQLKKFFRVESQGRTTVVWVFWDEEKADVQVVSSQQHCVRTKITISSLRLRLCATHYVQETSFWSALEAESAEISELLFVGGDFNYIVDSFERRGGSGYLHNDSTVFMNLINESGLIDMGFCGQNFTWSRGLEVENYVAKLLDRVLIDNDARFQWPEAFVHHLSKFGSDHTPLLLSLETRLNWNPRRRSFRFEADWLTHPQLPIIP